MRGMGGNAMAMAAARRVLHVLTAFHSLLCIQCIHPVSGRILLHERVEDRKDLP